MSNPLHLLTVAALLLVAFLVGAVVGTLARMASLRLARKPGGGTVAPATAVTPAAPPLVAAPVIAPLPVPAAPILPEPSEVPVPDFAATLIALANDVPPPAFIEASRPRVEPAPPARPTLDIRAVPPMPPLPAVPSALAMQPARVAGETTSVESAAQRTAEVILFPTAATDHAAVRPADTVAAGGSFVVVDTPDLVVAGPESAHVPANAQPVVVAAEPEYEPASGSARDDHFFFVGTPAIAASQTALVPASETASNSETPPSPVISANAGVGAAIAVDTPERAAALEPVLPKTVAVPDPAVSGPASEPILDGPAAVVPATEAQVAELPAAVPEVAAALSELQEESPKTAAASEPIVVAADEPMDEDAAMRAIEGNWSPRRTPPKRVMRPPAAPEGANEAVAASARAVIAARRTAESVVAEVAEVQAEVMAEAGRPAGLDAPRDGRKDDLIHIIGVLPVIETALNKLGLYHFDQVGALSDEETGWIEGHLGIPGRISRELWREQARELSAALRPKRVAEK